MKKETRQEFRAGLEEQVHFTSGYWYIGDYQPVTNTGRYPTRAAAIAYQMECWDMDHDRPYSHASEATDNL